MSCYVLAHAVFVCYGNKIYMGDHVTFIDVTSANSLENARKWFSKILKNNPNGRCKNMEFSLKIL